MKRVMAIGAGLGVLVAGFWAIYAAGTFPSALRSQPMIWDMIQVTCPILFASIHLHFGVRLYWVLAANAATYAFVAFIAETLRRQFRHA
jgi:hypothetical protein